MAKLSTDLRACLRDFAFYIANGSLDSGSDADYRELLSEPAFLEQALALWGNVIEVDALGMVTNREHAQKRVEQYIQTWVDKEFKVQPPFEDWEMELH